MAQFGAGAAPPAECAGCFRGRSAKATARNKCLFMTELSPRGGKRRQRRSGRSSRGRMHLQEAIVPGADASRRRRSYVRAVRCDPEPSPRPPRRARDVPPVPRAADFSSSPSLSAGRADRQRSLANALQIYLSAVTPVHRRKLAVLFGFLLLVAASCRRCVAVPEGDSTATYLPEEQPVSAPAITVAS